MVLVEPGHVVCRRPDLHEVAGVPRASQGDGRNRRRGARRPSARTARLGRTPPVAPRGGRPARTARPARSRPRGRQQLSEQLRVRVPRRTRAGRTAVPREAILSAGAVGLRDVQVEPESSRERPRRELSLDAASGYIEPRRERPEPTLPPGATFTIPPPIRSCPEDRRRGASRPRVSYVGRSTPGTTLARCAW